MNAKLLWEILKAAPYRKLSAPDEKVKSLNDIDPRMLNKDLGIETLFLDYDGTTNELDSYGVHSDIQSGFDNIVNYFTPDNILIVSSRVGNGRNNGEEKARIEESIGLVVASSSTVKPNKGALTEPMQERGWRPETTAIIGDSPIDMICGNRAGIYTIRVNPLISEDEPWYAPHIRRLGNYITERYKKGEIKKQTSNVMGSQ